MSEVRKEFRFISFGSTEKRLLEKAKFSDSLGATIGTAIFREDEMLAIAKGQYEPGITWYQVRWETEPRGIYETLGEALFHAGATYAQEVPVAFC